MLSRVLVILMVIVAVVEGLAAGTVPENILPLALVVLGLVYGVLCLEADNRTGFMVLAVAVGGAASTDVLNHIHVIGEYLDPIVDQLSTALYAGVVAALVMMLWERIMPADES